jgi:hypothetical protein
MLPRELNSKPLLMKDQGSRNNITQDREGEAVAAAQDLIILLRCRLKELASCSREERQHLRIHFQDLGPT